ncbi:hypothetical protein EDB80DRAFT_840613 [Ilyonectria destructans]|nr:hypothetical protein EDB80DRAFT_840613 [Ilyonectria destructans]
MAPGKLHAAMHRGNWSSWLTLAGHDGPGCCLASSRVSLPRFAQGEAALSALWPRAVASLLRGGNPSVAPIPFRVNRTRRETGANSTLARASRRPWASQSIPKPGIRSHVTYGTGLSTEVSCHGNAAVEPPEQLRNNLPAALHTAAHPCAAQTD